MMAETSEETLKTGVSLATPQVAVAPAPAVSAPRCVSVDGVRTYAPRLWQARERQRSGERPRQERDSLRSRSHEGRQGSRKHRRWLHAEELTRTLRRYVGSDSDEDDDIVQARPSAFHRLLDREGPERALEVLSAAEMRRPRSRPRRVESRSETLKKQARAGFGDAWPALCACTGVRNLVLEVERVACEAFGAKGREVAEEEGDWTLVAEAQAWAMEGPCVEWAAHWDGSALRVPLDGRHASADAVVVIGLDAGQRRFAHRLSSVMGLHSFSRDGECGRVLVLRPPRRHYAGAATWAPALSMTEVLPPARQE